MIKAYKSFSNNKSSGFIKELLNFNKLKEAKKEFEEIEYEVKFDVQVEQLNPSYAEPAIKEYLEAFDFPATVSARFIKDAVHNIAEGVNSFLGEDNAERMVVIQKMGKLYLKEKSQPIELNAGVLYQDIVIKRNERRWEAGLEEILEKIGEIGIGSFKGTIVKEKGDDFILDTNDGRIYSFTINRSKLKDKNIGEIQRQLEIEYAGFVPGFPGFIENSEKQIVQGMVDLAKYVAVLYNNAPVGKGWAMGLRPTHERKYDFVNRLKNGTGKLEPGKSNLVELVIPDYLGVREKVKEKVK